MSAGTGYFQRALCRLLSAHVFEVDGELLCAVEQLSRVDLDGRDTVSVVDQVNDLKQGAHWIYLDPAHHSSFASVCLGYDKIGNLSRSRSDRDGQCSTNAADTAVQHQLADKDVIGQLGLQQSVISAKDTHRQVEP